MLKYLNKKRIIADNLYKWKEGDNGNKQYR